MPKRTNPFQKLIYTIQHELAHEAVVTESKMLSNILTGSPVEVDVIIEAETGGIPLIIGIECIAEARAVTVEWVREMLGKHRDLPTDKLVLVSRSGFTSEAERYAAARRAEAIQLREAESFDWSKMVADLIANPNLRIANFEIREQSWTIRLYEAEKQRVLAKEKLSFGETSEVFSPEGESLGTVQQLGVSILRDRRIVQRIMQRWIKHRKEHFKLTWNPPVGTQISDADGDRYSIEAFVLDGSCEVESTPLSMTPAKYGKTQVAYGTVPDIFTGSTGEVMVVFTEKEGEQAKGALRFSSGSGFGEQIFPAIKPFTFFDSS